MYTQLAQVSSIVTLLLNLWGSLVELRYWCCQKYARDRLKEWNRILQRHASCAAQGTKRTRANMNRANLECIFTVSIQSCVFSAGFEYPSVRSETTFCTSPKWLFLVCLMCCFDENFLSFFLSFCEGEELVGRRRSLGPFVCWETSLFFFSFCEVAFQCLHLVYCNAYVFQYIYSQILFANVFANPMK